MSNFDDWLMDAVNNPKKDEEKQKSTGKRNRPSWKVQAANSVYRPFGPVGTWNKFWNESMKDLAAGEYDDTLEGTKDRYYDEYESVKNKEGQNRFRPTARALRPRHLESYNWHGNTAIDNMKNTAGKIGRTVGGLGKVLGPIGAVMGAANFLTETPTSNAIALAEEEAKWNRQKEHMGNKFTYHTGVETPWSGGDLNRITRERQGGEAEARQRYLESISNPKGPMAFGN